MKENVTDACWKKLPLQDIQANILRPHGREYAWCLFISFNGSSSDVAKWIYDLVSNPRFGITSAADQLRDSMIRKMNPGQDLDGGLVTCFFLSAEGFNWLGIDGIPSDPSFQLGMKDPQVYMERLNDPAPENWKDPNYRQPIHAMILLADNNDPQILAKSNEIGKSLEGKGSILFIEKGKRLHYKDSPFSFEHFGYRDDVTDIKFWDENYQLHPETWKLALYQESANTYGSFLVFRKLEQNVRAFRENLQKLAAELGDPDELDKAGAQVIGRYRDGRPLLMKKGHFMEMDEQFDFQSDPKGRKCPFHAHIRKVNPRDEAKQTRKHQIIRRGITYGNRNLDLGDSPETGVGLLFMCYQASIRNQFEYIVSQWANSSSPTGTDPIIGNSTGDPVDPSWNHFRDEDENPKKQIPFPKVVTLSGGEYFYAPSITMLKSLNFNIREGSSRDILTPNGGIDFMSFPTYFHDTDNKQKTNNKGPRKPGGSYS